ncbi:MAG: FAD binding domain-containing protein [Syntrophorhabdaceae bacterium]|nr:FAD binding domain-containing protein [Syntrophorhabdaceae bacterium]
MKTITFILNGTDVNCEVEETELLIDTLRERFKVKSVKEGCGIGECGACTVLIDNEPHYSCLTLSSKIEGHDIKTVEFLSQSGRLHPIQEAFIKAGAVQCGYCTPGMLLSVYSLLLKNPEPDTLTIREAISGNLCRCTGYQQIVEAVKEVVKDPDKTEKADETKGPEKGEGLYKVTKDHIFKTLTEKKESRIIAGGTDILVKARKGEFFGGLIDISDLDGLKGIRQQNRHIIIGAAVTHSEIKINPIIKSRAASLSIACGTVGSPQIRNMGTIGGNLVNASPAADSIPPLLIHDGVCILVSRDGSRRVPVEDFIVSPYKTSINNSEILESIEIEGLEGYREGYRKVARRAALAIARLSVAWAIKEKDKIFEDVRISIGSCTPMPFRPREVEGFLKGKEKDKGVFKEAVDMIIQGIVEKSGMRQSYVYKLPVLEGLLIEILRG